MNMAWPSVPKRTHSTLREMAVGFPKSLLVLTPCTISKMVSDPGLLRMSPKTPLVALKSKCTVQARLFAWLPIATRQTLQARERIDYSQTLASTAPQTHSITSKPACSKRNLCLWARIGARVNCSRAILSKRFPGMESTQLGRNRADGGVSPLIPLKSAVRSRTR